MNPDSEQTLNRFAAAEMTISEEGDFLALCEIDATRYRRAMLAVVEHRRIVGALQALELPNNVESERTPKTLLDSKLELDPQRNKRQPVWRRFGLAALFVLVAFGGYLLGNSQTDQTTGTLSELPESYASIDPVIETVSNDAAAVRASADSGDNINLFPSPADESVASVLADLVWSARGQRAFTPQSRERMQARGWEVEESPQIYLLSTDDGHRFAVPTHNANIHFVSE